MSTTQKALLEHCETLMLDMDGTLLDLAYDNYMWLTLVPDAYAERHSVSPDEARERLYSLYREFQGTLDWYCLDHWSDRLGLDILALHREERARIGFLPGAERFLESVSAHRIRVLLVTNSHADTLSLKSDETGLAAYFDRVYTSHDVGHAKEDQGFWRTILEVESFDPGTTLFVDDTVSVLASAREFGIRHLLHVTRPDTGKPERSHEEFAGIESVADLLDDPG